MAKENGGADAKLQDVPTYVSCATLARELDILSETTIHDMVRRGVLPRPVRFSAGCVRWRWTDVQRALASLSDTASAGDGVDPFMTGARNATAQAK